MGYGPLLILTPKIVEEQWVKSDPLNGTYTRRFQNNNMVGSMERAVAFSGDGVRPVHLPPGKEEEGTALPPDEPNRPFPVGSGA